MRVHPVVVGPPGHGVAEVGRRVAAAAGVVAVDRHRPLGPAEVDAFVARLPPGALHLDVTDHLFGDAAAADVVGAVCTARPTTITLHDLPQPADGPSYRRRARSYVRMAAAADRVVVSSRWELSLLRAAGWPGVTDVVPLPVATVGARRGAVDRVVGLIGWVYPGKGHVEAIDALPPGVGLRVLGGASPGHEDLLGSLARQASSMGRDVEVTGWLPADALLAEAARVAVPLVAHRKVSASGSLGSWLEAGRRPVVLSTPYAVETAVRLPGAVTLVDDLALGIAAALADPDATWLGDVSVGPSAYEVGRMLGIA